MKVVLELREVSKHYATHRAVNGISVSIERGEFFALLGPSGCGKTTTLRLIAGFEEPSHGEIRLSGANIHHLKPYQRNVSTVFQNYALFPHLTVQQNVEFGLQRRAENHIGKRVREVLELVQLSGKEWRYPSEISGGERQRVALARSLVLAPEVLLLDEPLSALDPNLRKQVRAELKDLQRRVGITFLFVTHDQEEALSMADRLGVMNAGELQQVGTPEEVYLRPRTRFVASFLGAINWIGDIGVRPEALRITKRTPGQGVRSSPATVVQSTFLGNCVHVEARLADGQTVVAQVSRLTEPFAAGEAVYVSWEPGDEQTFE
ncbi:MAG TPA: ABC transporter ATP-binding protein [Bryobacteraceae bacterium]|jgi:spermidine/putrescine transport system ATP-binding protein|nr:ABC transporter ATP-binding protein [Bryobacteraceae bacterium]